MPTEKMIPWLWLRLVALLAFTIITTAQGLVVVAAIAGVLFVLTAFQLRGAYRGK